MAEVVRFGPNYDDSANRIIKSENGIGLDQQKSNWAEPGIHSSSTRHTKVRAAIDALDYEYNHDAQRSRRASSQTDYSY